MKPLTDGSAKQTRGRNQEMVSLHVWINRSLDEQLSKVLEATGKEKHVIVSEALLVSFDFYRKAGILGP